MFMTFAYGAMPYAKQALLCALSIRERHPDAKVTIYTDQSEFFAAFDFIQVRSLGKIEIAAWQGPMRYKHGVKLGVLLRHALDPAAPVDSPIIYIDADTYHHGGKTDLEDRPLVMHNLDGLTGPTFYPKLHQFLIGNASSIEAPSYPNLSAGFKMYNSGLLGFPASLASARLFHAARRLTDWLCVHFSEQTDWLEQTAIAWLGTTGSGVTVDPMGFEHYWGKNTEMAFLLGEKSVPELRLLAADSDRFAALTAEAQMLQQDPRYRRTHLRRKRWNRSVQKRLAGWRVRSLRDPLSPALSVL